MDVAAHEGLKRLTVRKLDIEPAAVAFDQAESVQLAFISLILQHTEVAPIDLEAVAGAGFNTNECARNADNLAERFQIPLPLIAEGKSCDEMKQRVWDQSVYRENGSRLTS